ncbi:MAG: helix-turn-helix transcriptional regulator [Mycobacteriaceae bacterium]|nr:helix-turn-helix transcriptional regulator [Mycobacteriaceae bacterium]
MTASTAVVAAPTAAAQLWLRHGHAVYLGPSLGMGAHSTALACLGVGLDAPFTVWVQGAREAVTVRSFLFEARRVHETTDGDGRMLFCFFDPTSARMAGSLGGMRRVLAGGGAEHRNEAELIACCAQEPVDFPRLLRLASVPLPEVLDARVEAAAADIRSDPARKHGAADAAARAGLSTSHFLRLFAAQTGTSFRRYQQWARMLHVGRAFAAGHDFTRAAVDAGFSSPSHFSDTFRAMFGITPTRFAAVDGELVIHEEPG